LASFNTRGHNAVILDLNGMHSCTIMTVDKAKPSIKILPN